MKTMMNNNDDDTENNDDHDDNDDYDGDNDDNFSLSIFSESLTFEGNSAAAASHTKASNLAKSSLFANYYNLRM